MNLISSCKGSMMSLASSSACRVASEVVPYQFPAGLRVLVVDDDRPTLLILDKMLRTCLYDVRTCNRAEEALSLLRGNKNGFDIVLSDVHMPDMDGFKLLEHIGLEMELPVIMMSMDAGKDVVMKGITHGACDYLIKPVSLEALKNIWQHVVRKKKNEWKDLDQLASADEYGDWQQKLIGDVDYSSSANEGSCRSAKRRKVDEEEAEDKDDSSALKKPRVVWSVELHQQFVDAVNQLGIDKAVPKKILELMDVPGLTRENVASHLQKYRLYLRRLSGGSSHHQNNLANSFLNPQEAALGSISSLNGFHLHSLPVTSQMQAQSVVAPNPGMSTISVANQRNLFTFENPKLNPNMSKPINLLHGISTTLGSKNLTNFHHSTQSHGSMITQMPQPQSSAHIFNKTTSINSNIQRLPSSIGHPIFSNGIANGGVATTNRAGFSLVPSTSSILNSGVSHQIVELPGNSFPLQSTPLEMPTLTPKRGFAQELSPNSDVKGSGGFFQSYDVFSGLTLQNSNDWDLHYNIGLSFDASRNLNRIRPSLDVSSSGLVHQGFSSGIIGPTTFVGDNSMSVRAEKILDSSRQIGGILGGNFGQEDILSALLKQQEGIGTAETEFDFDGICIDNIPV